MSIYKSAINRPVTTLLVFVAVIVIGIFSFLRLPIDQFPEMDPPYISVLTVYPGASASEIETNVTKIIENNLNSVDYLKEITSTTKDNISVVMLELEWGTDLDEIINDVRSYIDMVTDELPDGCTNPFIFKFSTSSMPILQYSITADESYPGLDKLLNDEIIPQLSMVNGIGNLTLSGSPERYVYVDIDQQKLDAYGLPLETVGSAIAANNLNLSSGTVKMNKEQYQLEVRSEYVESSEINDIVVTVTPEGRQVFVRDLATVRDTIKDLSLDEKTNGRESVRLMVTKQTGANTVQICQDLEKELAKIEKTLPRDIKIETIYDSSEDIQNSISSLEESILYALLFVVLVVLFFLGEWRSTLIISLTIPISLIVAFIYLMLADSSLNIISLSSLTVAIGMVVDDAIVAERGVHLCDQRGVGVRHRHYTRDSGGVRASDDAYRHGRHHVQGTRLAGDHHGMYFHGSGHHPYSHALFQAAEGPSGAYQREGCDREYPSQTQLLPEVRDPCTRRVGPCLCPSVALVPEPQGYNIRSDCPVLLRLHHSFSDGQDRNRLYTGDRQRPSLRVH